jgi:hypothetical protein
MPWLGPRRGLGKVRKATILESSIKSSEYSSDFKHNRELFKLLLILGGKYRTDLLSGIPDSSAKNIFGESFAAKESRKTMKDKLLTAMRTFPYQGSMCKMHSHLKIGILRNTEETIRVHFLWNSRDKKIAIGYCGPHLETAG